MRYKAAFLAGIAIGFVAGARAGRERYEQMKKVATQAVQSPPVQKAAQAAGQKASELGKAAKDRAATQMPKLTETAKNSATKMRGQLDRLPGRHPAGNGASDGAQSDPAIVNGTRPAD
jgi:aspartate/methionine/tyrosine aminotransferase